MNRLAFAGSLALVVLLVPVASAQTSAARAARVQRPPAAASATIDLTRMRASSIEVEQPSGRGREISVEASRVQVSPWQYVAARTGTEVLAAPPAAGQEQAWALPVVISTADDTGAQLDLEIVVAVDNGLMLRGSDGVYSGDVFVGVLNRQDRTATIPLGAPVHVLLGGLVDAIDPAAGVQITHTNQPFARVAVRARPTTDEVRLRARASFASDGAEVPIPVVRPRLMLSVSPPKIQGLGVETADITVRAEGHPSPKDQVVTLGWENGRIEPGATVPLNDAGVATARLRGTALGSTPVRASAPGFRDAEPGRVEFGWPVWFVGAGIVGGLIGGFLKYRPRRGSTTTLTSALLRSALQGLGVAVLVAVGFNVISWAPTARAGAALVAGTALLGVWVNPGAIAKKNLTSLGQR